MAQDGLEMAQDSPLWPQNDHKITQDVASWVKMGQGFSKFPPTKSSIRPRWLEDVPKWSQGGPEMAQDGPNMSKMHASGLSWAFVFGFLRRFPALPPCFHRFAFAMPLLCLRFAFVLLCFAFSFRFPLKWELSYAISLILSVIKQPQKPRPCPT